jgi:hypothetical protein
MAHPHLALAIVLVLAGLVAAVWLGTLLTDANAELKRALGEDTGLDILRSDSYQPADDGFGPDEPSPIGTVELTTTHLPHRRPALYVVTRNCTHHGRHRR